jgi:8-oxo-dGTP pyrophosphatase MutT (NUDIX family)
MTLPEALSGRADVPVRDAATVILLRDDPQGLQVWLLTRVPQIVFAGGMAVFPGGRVDSADRELPWSGRSVDWWAQAFACEPDAARALVGAAVRETFEETGVLLTTPAAHLPAEEIARLQHEVESGQLSFTSMLSAAGLAIDSDALRPWARWVTPMGEKRRYDTHFFVAGLPSGAQAFDLTTESSFAAWVVVSDALASAERGERTLLPPTRAMLTSLAGLASVRDVFEAAEARDLAAVRPIMFFEPDGARIELPDGTVIGWFPRPAR